MPGVQSQCIHGRDVYDSCQECGREQSTNAFGGIFEHVNLRRMRPEVGLLVPDPPPHEGSVREERADLRQLKPEPDRRKVSEMNTTHSKEQIARDVIHFPEGYAVIEWPWQMSRESASEFIEMLHSVERRVLRFRESAAAQREPEGTP